MMMVDCDVVGVGIVIMPVEIVVFFFSSLKVGSVWHLPWQPLNNTLYYLDDHSDVHTHI